MASILRQIRRSIRKFSAAKRKGSPKVVARKSPQKSYIKRTISGRLVGKRSTPPSTKPRRKKTRKSKSFRAKRKLSKAAKDWSLSVKAARQQLGSKGFVPVGGKSKEGKELLKVTRQIHSTIRRGSRR